MDVTKKELYTAKRGSGLDDSSPAILETWQRIKNDADATNWFLITYTANNTVDVCASGVGGIQELCDNLNNDDVFFGGYRTTSEPAQFYAFYFVGQNVGGMKKGRASMHKPTVLNKLEGCRGEMSFLSEDDMDVTKSKILAACSQ